MKTDFRRRALAVSENTLSKRSEMWAVILFGKMDKRKINYFFLGMKAKQIANRSIISFAKRGK